MACVYDAHRRSPCYHAVLSAHDAEALRGFVTHVRAHFGEPRCCYEASSCGYVLYLSLRELGVHCEVIAPGAMPRRTGDRIKTDQWDAKLLAEYFTAGILTACLVPDQLWESARDLVRSQADLHRPKVRARSLLRSRGNDSKPWTRGFMTWLNGLMLALSLIHI